MGRGNDPCCESDRLIDVLRYSSFSLETLLMSFLPRNDESVNSTHSIHPSFQDAVRPLYKGATLFAQSTVRVVQIELGRPQGEGWF